MEVERYWDEDRGCVMYSLYSLVYSWQQATGFEMLYQESKGRTNVESGNVDVLKSSVCALPSICPCH
jgi:hypothetical protein